MAYNACGTTDRRGEQEPMRPWLCILPVAAYLYGSVPFGFLAAWWLKGVDIRIVGSGNIGATNAARVLGFRFFPLIFLLDMSKGMLPALAMGAAVTATRWDPHPLVLAAGMAGVLGHVFPLYLRFKGGKAVATGTGLFLVIAPWAVLIAGGVWAAVFLARRYVSLASITAAVALPVALALTQADPWDKGLPGVILAAVASAFIIWLHRANIGRLLAGTESRVGRGRIQPGPE